MPRMDMLPREYVKNPIFHAILLPSTSIMFGKSPANDFKAHSR